MAGEAHSGWYGWGDDYGCGGVLGEVEAVVGDGRTYASSASTQPRSTYAYIPQCARAYNRYARKSAAFAEYSEQCAKFLGYRYAWRPMVRTNTG